MWIGKPRAGRCPVKGEGPRQFRLARDIYEPHNPRPMSARLFHARTTAWRALVNTGCLGAVLFALVLSAAPQLHEQVHGAANTHECAVTLLTSGNYQHTVVATISVAPPAPFAGFISASERFSFRCAHLEFTLLEHAPPAIS